VAGGGRANKNITLQRPYENMFDLIGCQNICPRLAINIYISGPEYKKKYFSLSFLLAKGAHSLMLMI